MEKILLGVGVVSFIGYLIWLVVCAMKWDSKIPPIVGMLLSVVMILGGLSTTGYKFVLEKSPDPSQLQPNSAIISNEEHEDYNESKEFPENETMDVKKITVSDELEDNVQPSELDEKTKNFDVVSSPPIQLNSYTLKKDSIGDPMIQLDATNKSDQIIKSFSVIVFAYDNDGVPVKVYFNDFSKGLEYSDALKIGESTKKNSYWTLYAEYNEIKQIVVILGEVEYFNGTTWVNPNGGTLFSRYNERILPAGDENILPKA